MMGSEINDRPVIIGSYTAYEYKGVEHRVVVNAESMEMHVEDVDGLKLFDVPYGDDPARYMVVFWAGYDFRRAATSD